jgi:ABC-2 type transport system permease protein
MWPLFIKEINSFYSSLIAWLVISVFLIATGIFLWILPDWSIFDYGYATLEQLFGLAPWVLMFLVPALSMRSFSEEQKSGTYELLMSKPLGIKNLILAKYFSILTIVLFSLLPTLLYYYTVYQLASPVGNLDHGGILGSYLGLLLIGAFYAGIGTLSSLINDNQIISFLTSLILCLFFYYLLDAFRSMAVISPLDPFLEFLSLKTHYISISRGVIDSRDILYFLSFTGLFLYISAFIMQKRKFS